MKKAALIINSKSRKGANAKALIKKTLQSSSIDVNFSHLLTDPTELDDAIAGAQEAGAEIIIIGGGDGTLAHAAGILSRTSCALGVIPLGTTNNFSRSLGIGPSIPKALEVITQGKVASIDIGMANGLPFANTATIGVSSNLISKVTFRQKKRYGRLAYALAGLKTLFDHPSFEISYINGGESFSYKTRQLMVANGRYHAGRPLTSDAGIDDDLLHIYIMASESKIMTLAHTLMYMIGRGEQRFDAITFTAPSITIHAQPSQPVELDGEVKTSTPVTIEVVNNALKVMVPKSFEDK